MSLLWSCRSLLGAVLLSLAATIPLQAQMRGYSPNRLQQLDQVGEALPAVAKDQQKLATAAFINTESDYLDSTFWDAPPFLDGSVPFRWPEDWGVTDRRGDTRLKSSRILAKWNPQHDGTGSDHFYLRFDLQRVVTSAADFTSQGHLSNTTYALMRDGGLLSGKTKIKIQLGVAYEKPDYVVNYVNWSEEVHLHDLSYDVMVLDVNGVPVNTLFQGLKYGRFAPTMELTVPTTVIRFPVKGAPEPSPAWNVVHFRLVPPKVTSPDVYGSFGHFQHVKIPATFIPYSLLLDAELSFGAVAPIFLVHGTNAKPGIWNVPRWDSFNDYFKSYLGLCFNDIALSPNGPIDGNGAQLKDQMTAKLATVGAKQCHLVAHSKGGNDSRSMIYNHYEVDHFNEHLEQPGHFEVLSLYTLETPHRGTVAADISWAILNSGDPFVMADPAWPGLQNIIHWDYKRLHKTPDDDPNGEALAPSGEALTANTTASMNEWNTKNPVNFANANGGRPIKFYNTAADADWNIRNRIIDPTENAVENSIGLEGSQYPTTSVATSEYQMLYWAKKVIPRQIVNPDFSESMITELYIPNQNPHDNGTWNDLVVAIDSARFDGGTPFCPASLNSSDGILLGNHSGVKTREMAAAIADQISFDWRVQ